MKINFEDSSFIQLDKSARQDKAVSMTMCGFNANTKKLIMSYSELDEEQVQALIVFLQSAVKKS